jgi:hypothetical protein
MKDELLLVIDQKWFRDHYNRNLVRYLFFYNFLFSPFMHASGP